ncbi:MAG: hypothetical protein ACYDD1_05260 [Caulobacteraceae bacterium]
MAQSQARLLKSQVLLDRLGGDGDNGHVQAVRETSGSAILDHDDRLDT